MSHLLLDLGKGLLLFRALLESVLFVGDCGCDSLARERKN